MYKLSATRNGVKINFEDDSAKTIYRKTYYETTWTEVTTISEKDYLDNVARSPRVITYKIDDEEINILFTTIDKLFERNIQEPVIEVAGWWDGINTYTDGINDYVLTGED